MRPSDFGVTLIGEPRLGFESERSDGRAPNELLVRERRGALRCAKDLPSDDRDQNDKQRSCFWSFMEVGEWSGMTPPFSWRNPEGKDANFHPQPELQL
jgi:hypothetical protein